MQRSVPQQQCFIVYFSLVLKFSPRHFSLSSHSLAFLFCFAYHSLSCVSFFASLFVNASQRTNVRLVGAAQKLVKPVEVALVGILADTAALLQQVRVNRRANDKARAVKVNADEFALTRV